MSGYGLTRTFVFLLCGLAAHPAVSTAGGYRVLAYFPGGTYVGPAGIMEETPGIFYALSTANGVISVTAKGTFTTFATFQDPPDVVISAPTPAANKRIYSSVNYGGSGPHANVFSVGQTTGTEQIYASEPLSPGLAGNVPSGSLFGIACPVGVAGACSFAFINTQGVLTPFYQFPSTDMLSQPIYGSDGNYYGTGYTFGVASTYLYQLTPGGSFSKIVVMPFSGGGFVGAGLVLQGSDGNYYGIQQTGGGCSSANQHGAVYKVTPSGQFSILHDFGVCGKAIVNALIQASDGNLYGAIQGTGALFRLTTSGEYKELFHTTNGSTEGLCPCWLLQGSNGQIYGMAQGGGPHGDGVLFALDLGLPAPAPQQLVFSPASGAVGTKVRIWGRNLLSATAQFNGLAATDVYNSGPNYVWATVPPGATTGPITITTPGGTATTSTSFTVE